MFQKKSYGEFAKNFAKETKIPLKAAKKLVEAAVPAAKGRLSKKITSPKLFKILVKGVVGAAKENGRRLYKSGRSEDKFRRDLVNRSLNDSN